MGAAAALQQMVVLFFGIVIGFAARRLNIIDDAGCKVITKVVMTITLPCFIVASGFVTERVTSGADIIRYFLASLACYLAAYLIGTALSRLPLLPRKDRRLSSFMTTFGNTGFIGLPVVGALFGSDAVFYATVFNLPFNFLVFSIGVLLVSDEASIREIRPRTFFNACLGASVLAIVLYLTAFRAPTVVEPCLDTIGSATVPLAMIITGASLGKETFRSVFADPGLYVVSLAKVAAVPLVSHLLLTLVVPDPQLVKIGTVLMAMPVAANATLLCMQYGGNDRLASRGVFLSTLFSVATVPLLVLLLG